MKNKNYFLVGAVVLALAAGLTPRAHAQAFDKKYAKSLILSGGTSTTNTYTIFAPTLTSAATFTWPATLATAPGTLYNDFASAGLGVLSWQATFIDPTQLAGGANNTFFTTSAGLVPAWTPLAVDTTLNGNGSSSALSINLTHADTWTGTQTVSKTTNGSDAMLLANTTPATSGSQFQYPPRLRFSGQGWASTSSTSKDIDWILQAIPVTGAAAPTSYLDFEDGLSNTGYSTNFEIFSSGGSTLGVSSPVDPGVGVLNVASGLQVAGVGTAGALLIGNASGIFVPTAVTYPPSVGAAGNVVRSNGTNFISTPPNTHQYQPSTSFNTSSTSGVMMGLGAGSPAVLDTPKYSGKLLIFVTGNAYSSLNSTTITAQLHYGTGTPPASGGAPAGTAVGSQFSGAVFADDNHYFFSTSALVEGLTFSSVTPIWLDLEVSASGGATATVNDVTVTVLEY